MDKWTNRRRNELPENHIPIMRNAKSKRDKKRITLKILEYHLLQILFLFTVCPKILNIPFLFFLPGI